LREYAKDMDPELLNQLIEKESPDLGPMLYELQESASMISHRLKPSLEILSSQSELAWPKNCKTYL